MPQIVQLPLIFASQLFWLLLVFGIIYFVVGRGMVPKIQATVDQRDNRIAGDLAAAQAARDEAEATEAAYRERMDVSRAEALQLSLAARQEGAKATEERLKAVDGEIGARIAEAEARIRAKVEAARSELEAVAAEAAQDLVTKLTGAKVDAAAARQAVQGTLNG